MTALATLGSIVSPQFQKAVYKTEALLQAPRAEDIQLLNAHIEDVIELSEVNFYRKYGVQKLKKADVFEVFKKNLHSHTRRINLSGRKA